MADIVAGGSSSRSLPCAEQLCELKTCGVEVERGSLCPDGILHESGADESARAILLRFGVDSQVSHNAWFPSVSSHGLSVCVGENN